MRFVAAIDRNNNGNGALSLILDAGPNAASSNDAYLLTVRDCCPMNDASINDINGGHAHIPNAGNVNAKQSLMVGVGGYGDDDDDDEEEEVDPVDSSTRVSVVELTPLSNMSPSSKAVVAVVFVAV